MRNFKIIKLPTLFRIDGRRRTTKKPPATKTRSQRIKKYLLNPHNHLRKSPPFSLQPTSYHQAGERINDVIPSANRREPPQCPKKHRPQIRGRPGCRPLQRPHPRPDRRNPGPPRRNHDRFRVPPRLLRSRVLTRHPDRGHPGLTTRHGRLASPPQLPLRSRLYEHPPPQHQRARGNFLPRSYPIATPGDGHRHQPSNPDPSLPLRSPPRTLLLQGHRGAPPPAQAASSRRNWLWFGARRLAAGDVP